MQPFFVLAIILIAPLAPMAPTFAPQADIESQAKKLASESLDEEERMIEGDTTFAINDILKHYATDAIKVAGGKTMKGSAELTEFFREIQTSIEEGRAAGIKIDRKLRIDVVKRLADATVLVTVNQTTYMSGYCRKLCLRDG